MMRSRLENQEVQGRPPVSFVFSLYYRRLPLLRSPFRVTHLVTETATKRHHDQRRSEQTTVDSD